MTLSANYAAVTYNADDSTVEFAFSWPIVNTSEIVVTYIDADDVETILTETTEYTVSRSGNDYSSGGLVTTVATYATGEQIEISRVTPHTQDRAASTLAKPTQIELALDKITRTLQEFDERLDDHETRIATLEA